MLSAPTSAPRSSTTSSWLTLCCSISCTASTASASARIVRGLARHHVVDPALLEVDAFLERAAQVAVGEDAAHAAAARRRTAVMPMRPRVISTQRLA